MLSAGSLSSATQQLIVVPRHRLSTVGHQAFAVHGPMVWNSLPDDLRTQQDYEPLRRAWKPGFSPDTSVFRELETFVIALYKSISTIPYHTIMRGRLHSSCVRSSMLHGSETRPVRKENVVALQWAEMRMVRWMCGIKVKYIQKVTVKCSEQHNWKRPNKDNAASLKTQHDQLCHYLKSDHAHHVFDPDLSWQQYKNTLKFQYKLASIFRKKF